MTGHVITEIYAWVAKTPEGNEGIPAVRTPGDLIIPLVTNNPERVELLRASAMQVLDEPGVSLKLVKFTERVEVENFPAKEVEG